MDVNEFNNYNMFVIAIEICFVQVNTSIFLHNYTRK